MNGRLPGKGFWPYEGRSQVSEQKATCLEHEVRGLVGEESPCPQGSSFSASRMSNYNIKSLSSGV